MGSPHAASYITADRPAILEGRDFVRPELLRFAFGAEHIATSTSHVGEISLSDDRIKLNISLTACDYRLMNFGGETGFGVTKISRR